MTAELDEAGRAFLDPARVGDFDGFHRSLTLLRENDPVHWVDEPGFRPFWAITKHADVFEIETKPDLFLNAPRPLLAPAEADDARDANGDMLRTLIHMDAPDHTSYRRLTAEWFLPKSLAKLDDRLKELARQSADSMMAMGGSCDFARDVAMRYPLQVILSILGLPDSDYDRMLTLTQELFGAADPDLQRGTTMEDLQQVITDFFTYFTALSNDRRATPTGDLASFIANGRIDDQPLGDLEMISYYVIVATAGHDTTSAAIAGGLWALLTNPDQLERLRNDMSLLPAAVDEMIRWVTPVTHFMRTATADFELRGRTIKKGQSVLLSYPSANRDEEMFADPFRFDVGRTPNRVMSFGFGVHYCLGAMLARMEMRAFFEELLPRLTRIELAGEAAHMQTTFVGGLKRLPVTFELTNRLQSE